MSILLISNAAVLVAMDDQRREIKNGAIVVRDKLIEAVGSNEEMLRLLNDKGVVPDRHIDASDCILMPGLVNCHHHLYQTLTAQYWYRRGQVAI